MVDKHNHNAHIENLNNMGHKKDSCSGEQAFHLHNPDDKDAHSPNTVFNHTHHNHNDYQSLQNKSINTLKFVIGLTFSFALIEAVSGYFFNSLALMSDAAHMFTDSSSLFLALIMAYFSKLPADSNHSYGHGRFEVLGALFNALFMLIVIGAIFYAAIGKFQSPQEVKAIPMLIVASIGLFINILVFYILQKDSHNMNIKAAVLHVIGDLLGSVAAIISAIIIYYTGWQLADPILSVLICFILIPSTFSLLKRSIHILLEGVPHNLNIYEVGEAMQKIQGIESVHDLHIWTIDSKNLALTAHIKIEKFENWEELLDSCEKMLNEKFSIAHITLQPEILKKCDTKDI